jgi:hypothetical protein
MEKVIIPVGKSLVLQLPAWLQLESLAAAEFTEIKMAMPT